MSEIQSSKLIINDRSELIVNGIDRVLGFDNDYVLLESEEGRITIEGSALAIDSLTKENGEIVIKGKITAVIYSDVKSDRKGFFARALK